MGSDRKWIYLAYIVFTLILAWVLNQAVVLVLDYFRLPNPMLLGVLRASALASVVVTATSAYLYVRQEKVDTFSTEVVQELKKVTWPTRKTTYLSTIVVLVSVVIAAVILGMFDWACASFFKLLLRA